MIWKGKYLKIGDILRPLVQVNRTVLGLIFKVNHPVSVHKVTRQIECFVPCIVPGVFHLHNMLITFEFCEDQSAGLFHDAPE